jgi:hypothetical protein
MQTGYFDKLIDILEMLKLCIVFFFSLLVAIYCLFFKIIALLFHGHIRTVVIISALLTACSTMTPRTCEQKAWEAAGNAMANVQYNLEAQTDWNKRVNCTSFPVCMEAPILSTIETGYSSGPTSDTFYKGPSSREAYVAALKTCQSPK